MLHALREISRKMESGINQRPIAFSLPCFLFLLSLPLARCRIQDQRNHAWMQRTLITANARY